MTETSLIWIIGYPLRVFELPLSAVMKIYKVKEAILCKNKRSCVKSLHIMVTPPPNPVV